MFQNEKIIEIKTCKHCQSSFSITDKDLEFYEKISPKFRDKKYFIPIPSLCPDCRQQRRLSFRNERKLYKRKCDATGKLIISIYSPDKPYKVYEQSYWWSDSWNALDYGKDFDFSKSFFGQFGELLNKVPKQSLIGANNVNSEYCNLTADNKNCYLIYESSNNEDCIFGYWLQKCNNCVDVSFSHECNECYYIQDSFNCYNLFFSNNCEDCRDSFYLENCYGCKNCFASVNLNNKEYFILNKKYSKEKYFEILQKDKENIKKEFEKLFKNSIKKYGNIKLAENSYGDYMKGVKNCVNCFHAYDAEDCKYAEHIWRNAKNCMDVSTAGRDAEFVYESINCGIGDYNFNFCVQCWTGSSLNYCMFSSNIHNCFGCVGLVNKSYCILNKQYSKEEYEILVPKIIEHMISTGEWGEFFPSTISPFGYNETVAQEYFPISRDKALPYLYQDGKQIFNWSDYEPPFPKVEKIITVEMYSNTSLLEDANKVPDDILNRAIECEITKKPFRIIKQELEFYRKHNLPILKRHPDQRHLDRMNLRNPRKLFDRKCDKCGKDIKTTYSPERHEIVYCEECYNKEIY
ncbi:MAG: hypothetical protein PHE25_02860 [Candidatus Gracilibacteria bacterium]|nr:hypothetical protein [Candidatus Gracilibacteria bacterium]